MAVMELAKPLFPNLTDIQIIEYVDRVKKKFGTLKGKTNDEIIQEMCKFMQAEGKKIGYKMELLSHDSYTYVYYIQRSTILHELLLV